MQTADDYARRIRELTKRNGRLHAQIWARNDKDDAAQLRREIEANTRSIREATILSIWAVCRRGVRMKQAEHGLRALSKEGGCTCPTGNWRLPLYLSSPAPR